MDRRGFLKLAGIGGALVAAAPQLVLPQPRSLPGAERTVFTPPAGGWPNFSGDNWVWLRPQLPADRWSIWASYEPPRLPVERDTPVPLMMLVAIEGLDQNAKWVRLRHVVVPSRAPVWLDCGDLPPNVNVVRATVTSLGASEDNEIILPSARLRQ